MGNDISTGKGEILRLTCDADSWELAKCIMKAFAEALLQTPEQWDQFDANVGAFVFTMPDDLSSRSRERKQSVNIGRNESCV